MAFLNFLVSLSFMFAVSGRVVVHESRAAAPAPFVPLGRAPADQELTLRIALASNNIAGLEERLLSISTPGSSEFRQWLSMEEVKTFVQPSKTTVAAFESFAATNGLNFSVVSPHEDWVSITLPVSRANDLFAADFELFSHPSMASLITRTLSVSLPVELVGHIDVVHPTTEFTEPNARHAATIASLKKRAPAASCNTFVASGVMTPACLQQLYGIPTTAATSPNNTLLVTGYLSEFAQTADLAAFLKLLRPDMPSNTTFTMLSIDHGENTQNPTVAGVEANLDVQYTTGIATGVPVQFLSVGSSFATALLDTITFLDGVPNPPTVVTTSYGTLEAGFLNTMSTKLCNGYMALGARGISLVFSTGDGGVRGVQDDTCTSPEFSAVFPASCPWVTSVGSTQGFGPETAANFSGGGFSGVFPTPAYQSSAVAGFLKTVPAKFPGEFNRSGRGYPDVSVQGVHFQFVTGGVTGLVGGTSLSTPTFASMIALVNDRLIAAGKPVLGFLNPFIYLQQNSSFTDITIGHNSGNDCPVSSVAFDAAIGWDALTGLGTPIFPELLAAALAGS
ncbi:family S53 protease-like protein [Mycena olivaceomarginata]|nr:family S53 protease-like protein [Mycena olivaceomarginata]